MLRDWENGSKSGEEKEVGGNVGWVGKDKIHLFALL